MTPILNINRLKSDNEDQSVFKVTITQGADQITTEEDLLSYIESSVPVKKGIISIEQSTSNIWLVTAHK